MINEPTRFGCKTIFLHFRKICFFRKQKEEVKANLQSKSDARMTVTHFFFFLRSNSKLQNLLFEKKKGNFNVMKYEMFFGSHAHKKFILMLFCCQMKIYLFYKETNEGENFSLFLSR